MATLWPASKRLMDITIRDFHPKTDWRVLMTIEQLSYNEPWDERDFKSILQRRNRACVIVVYGQHPAGFAIVESLPKTVVILNLAIHPECRRRGIGKALLGWICDRASVPRNRKVVIEIRETNLDAQLFLKSSSFQATEVLRGYYSDTGEDCYRFERTA